MDKIVVSIEGSKKCMHGQAYVAFSRVKTLGSLYLLGFDAVSIRVKQAVINEMDHLRQKPELKMDFEEF